MTDLTPPNMATGAGANMDSYKSSSHSYQSYSGSQRLGMAGGGAEFSYNNNNAANAGSDSDIARQFASLSGMLKIMFEIL